MRHLMSCFLVTGLIIALSSAPSHAEEIFSEDFQTYGDAGFITDAPNPNGWQLETDAIVLPMSFSAGAFTKTVNATQASRTFDIFSNGDVSSIGAFSVDQAASSTLPGGPYADGILSVGYDLQYIGPDLTANSGLVLRNSTTGDQVGITYSLFGLQLDVNNTIADDVGTGFFADNGGDDGDEARVEMLLDLTNNTVSASATMLGGGQFQNGTTFSSTGPFPLPAGLALDEIVLANVATPSGNGAYDNLSVSLIPEPPSLPMWALGAAFVMVCCSAWSTIRTCAAVKHLRTIVASALTLVLMTALTASASADVLFSGSGDPQSAGFDFNSTIPGDTAANPMGWDFDTESGSPQPGILYQDTTAFSGIGTSETYYRLAPATAAAELNRADGWFVTFRMQSLQNTGDRFGTFLAVEDDAGGIGALFNPDSFEFYRLGFGAYSGNPATADLFAGSLSSGYHTVELEMAPGGTNVDVSLDGSLIGSVAADQSNGSPQSFLFGDGSSGSAGQANWDFVGINATVPEPSGVAIWVLCTGFLLVFHRYRRFLMRG